VDRTLFNTVVLASRLV